MYTLFIISTVYSYSARIVSLCDLLVSRNCDSLYCLPLWRTMLISSCCWFLLLFFALPGTSSRACHYSFGRKLRHRFRRWRDGSFAPFNSFSASCCTASKDAWQPTGQSQCHVKAAASWDRGQLNKLWPCQNNLSFSEKEWMPFVSGWIGDCSELQHLCIVCCCDFLAAAFGSWFRPVISCPSCWQAFKGHEHRTSSHSRVSAQASTQQAGGISAAKGGNCAARTLPVEAQASRHTRYRPRSWFKDSSLSAWLGLWSRLDCDACWMHFVGQPSFKVAP